MNQAEIVIYLVSKLLIFHPHLKEAAIECNHTHTPTASDHKKTECALCAQLFISISPVLRGTKWAFKLQSPESSVAGGQAAGRCLGWEGTCLFTGVAHLALHLWLGEGLRGNGTAGPAGTGGEGEHASSGCRGLRRSVLLPKGMAERNAINSQTKDPLHPPQRKHMW